MKSSERRTPAGGQNNRGKSAPWLACSHFVNDGGSALKGNAPNQIIYISNNFLFATMFATGRVK